MTWQPRDQRDGAEADRRANGGRCRHGSHCRRRECAPSEEAYRAETARIIERMRSGRVVRQITVKGTHPEFRSE